MDIFLEVLALIQMVSMNMQGCKDAETDVLFDVGSQILVAG